MTRCSDLPMPRLFRSHANSAVKADRLAVEHVVFNNVLGQSRELWGLAQANGEWHLLSKRSLRSFRQASEQWRVKNSRSDSAYANAGARQLTRKRQRHADDATF